MCGICGVVSFRGEPVDVVALNRARAALKHRGPDQSGCWIDQASGGAVGLGATRLCVLDPSPVGHQPMRHRSGRFHLVYNGEVYNFRELRTELVAMGDKFATEGDTEVVLAACARWGTDALNRFNGMWALCFYDSAERAGFLARDRFGIKPLLYSLGGAKLAFASELNALTCLGSIDSELDGDALLQHLQFGYIAHPRTIYRSMRRLSPGQLLLFNAKNAADPSPFYDVLDRIRRPFAEGDSTSWNGTQGDSQDPCRPEPAARSQSLVRKIARAVTVRRVSDVPIGAFLSGGLDSSIVVHHLAAASPQPVKTFCVGYEGQRSFDERRYARLVAERYETDHHEMILSDRDVLAAVPRVLDRLGEPFGDSSIIPTALLSEFARRHVTVALSGDGGDELFGGYWRYLGHGTLDAYSRIPRLLRRLVVEPAMASLSASRAGVLANRVRQFRKLLRAESADALARHVVWSRILSPQAECVLAHANRAADLDAATASLARRLTDLMPDDDPLNRVLAFDLLYQLPSDMLHKVDQASMMHSLEVRVPLLDYGVVEHALGLPSSAKIDRGIRKRILIDAYRGVLPDDVLDRPKQGFEVPIGEYLRGPLQPMFRDVVSRSALESIGMLSYDGVERVFQAHLARQADHTDLLFAVLSLCWWWRRQARTGP